MAVNDLTGCRVLVVEDEALIAFEIENILEALGCEIVGPVSTLETGLQLVQDAAVDAAILDVTVRGGKIYPVAEQLLARNIPFVLASGYEDWALPDTLRDFPRLTKPFTTAELVEVMRFLSGEFARRKRAIQPNGPSVKSTDQRVS
jgi:two-component SAPR family response regulator